MPYSPVQIGTISVNGVDVDAQTRCAHYHSPVDIIAIQFPCCGDYYSCYRCHEDMAGHPAAKWPRDQFHHNAILCGACGSELTINQYLASRFRCPSCNAQFNEGCAKHYALYFEIAPLQTSVPA